MRTSGSARRRALIGCVLFALAAALAGCAAPSGTTVTVSGQKLTVYVSAPAGTGADATATDVVDAERLAFNQAPSTIGGFRLRLRVVRARKPSDNARTAIKDSSAIAYLGEVAPGSSGASVGIVGDQGILAVSPTDNAVELTQATPAVPGAPGIYYEGSSSSVRTFARVVPSTALEAKALVADMQALHVSKLFVTDDGQAYGAALASAVRQAAGSSVTVVQGRPTVAGFTASGAEALFYGTASRAAAGALFDQVAAQKPSTVLFGASALNDQGFAAALGPAAQRELQISAPGELPADQSASAKQFISAFTAAYGHPPATEAIFGYEAMSAVLAVLKQAGGNAGNRTTVVHDFFGLANRSSVLGTYSINASGDTSLTTFVISHMRAGRLTPYRSEG